MLLKFTRIYFLFKTFLALLTIYDSADGNSFLQFLEAASSGAWGVQQKPGIFQVCLNQVVFQ